MNNNQERRLRLEDVQHLDDLHDRAALAAGDQGESAEDAHAFDDDAPTPGLAVRPQPAALLVQLVLKEYRLGLTEDGRPFAAAHDSPHIALMIDEARALRQGAAALYHQAFDKAPSSSALNEAFTVLAGMALREPRETVWTRVGQATGTIYLDLGDQHNRVIAVNKTGWSVGTQAPVLFRRSALTAAIPEPRRDGNLDRLWTVLNVEDRYKPVLIAWLVAALVPDIPHPVLGIFGEQGTGKTTAMRVLAGFVDPSTAPSRRTPRDENAWVVAAAGSWVVPLDNVSKLPAWLSDALCRAVTGDADVARTFYTNGDLTVFRFRRVVAINGIDLGATRGDLAERLVAVRLHPISASARRLDAELSDEVAGLTAEVLGALLDLLVSVLRILPSVQLDQLPRMADFARILSAVDQILGTAGLATYLGLRDEMDADTVTSDSVLIAITNSLRDSFEGTAAELHARLQDEQFAIAPPPGWPRTARELTTSLRRHAPTLRNLGWAVDDLGRGGRAKAVRFRIVPPTGDTGDTGDAGDESETWS